MTNARQRKITMKKSVTKTIAKTNGISRREIFRSGAARTAALLSAAGATPLSAAAAPEPRTEPPPDVYTHIGVRPVINCTATVTSNGGSRTLPEVIEAIEHASHYHVNLDDLMEAAGRRISELLQVEWAMVSSGAASALTHATAGCIAGSDPERMQQLPKMDGLKNEVITPKSSRTGYDYAVRMVGVKMIEVDSAEELQAAINQRTGMIIVLGDRFGSDVRLPLKEVAPIAKKAGVPVLVDAAADYLIAPNPYIAEGADLVAYSGGKISRGPQGGGLLVGREDLVRAAFANSAPHHAFGRPLKVSKEEIVGVTTAVEVFMTKRDLVGAEYREWESWYDHIDSVITKVDGVSTLRVGPSRGGPFPVLTIQWDPAKIGLTAGELGKMLLDGEPSIATHASGNGHSFRFRPVALKPHEYQIVAERMHSLFRNAPPPKRKPVPRPPAADISGRWDVEIKFLLGEASQQLFLEADGNHVSGTHKATRLTGKLSGSIDGDRVRFRSTLPYESSNPGYSFEGKVSGDSMSGTISSSPSATWTAKRHDYA